MFLGVYNNINIRDGIEITQGSQIA